MPFTHTLESHYELLKLITAERLTPYLVETNGNLPQAIALYEQNSLLSQSLYGVLQTFEVALRNSIHSTLSTGFSNIDWFDIPSLLKNREPQSIKAAKKNLHSLNKGMTSGRIVAELTLGFWVRLHAPEYEKAIWVPHGHKAYPHLARPDRAEVFNRLDAIRKLRNRIAHHEHIFKRSLFHDCANINQALAWLSPASAAWMDATNTLMPLLNRLT